MCRCGGRQFLWYLLMRVSDSIFIVGWACSCQLVPAPGRGPGCAGRNGLRGLRLRQHVIRIRIHFYTPSNSLHAFPSHSKVSRVFVVAFYFPCWRRTEIDFDWRNSLFPHFECVHASSVWFLFFIPLLWSLFPRFVQSGQNARENINCVLYVVSSERKFQMYLAKSLNRILKSCDDSSDYHWTLRLIIKLITRCHSSGNGE